MRATKMNKMISIARLVVVPMVAFFLAVAAHAATPGISGTTFNLVASTAFLSQPDGNAVYSWGYGCLNTTGITFVPAAITTGTCNTMQVPGPTLVVTEGQSVTVILTNNLPASAGNTSILFPGFTVATSGGVAGLLTQEAAPGGTVTYTFTASTPGTRAYYSGTQGDLQVEMGLFGAIIVLPSAPPAVCGTIGAGADGLPVTNPGGNKAARANWGESDFRLAAAAYDHPDSCYDREYLFQFSEMDPAIHNQAQAQSTLACTGCMVVATEPYHPAYFMINGRSMPDDMDPNYAAQYQHQPYNGNPHMHPGELTLLRIIGQGRWQHPFHEHGNHVHILARDGNLIVASSSLNYPTSYSAAGAVATTASAPALA